MNIYCVVNRAISKLKSGVQCDFDSPLSGNERSEVPMRRDHHRDRLTSPHLFCCFGVVYMRKPFIPCTLCIKTMSKLGDLYKGIFAEDGQILVERTCQRRGLY